MTRLRYIPGRLWPVNKPAVRTIANLFGKNERLVFDFELEGGGLGWVVMVGAFNVGRMTTRLDPDFVTNAVSRQLEHQRLGGYFPHIMGTVNGSVCGRYGLIE